MGRQRSGWSALIARFSLLAGIAALSLPAVSHDWYPMECCSGTDCAVVEQVTYGHGLATDPALPIFTVTTKHDTAAVPPISRARNQKTERCMPAYGRSETS